MATYRLSVKFIGRSSGKNISAVAAAAYRSEEKLKDELKGKTFDYSKKNYCIHSEIIIPENAPARFKDREKLWNEIESVEKRKDSQLTKEFQLSLPHELKLEQQKELVKNFCKKELVSKGIICDIAIHNEKNRNKNYHAHILTTLRNIEKNKFGNKNIDWNRKELLIEWRHKWEKEVNTALERQNIKKRVCCLSNIERGLPTPVLPTLNHKTFNLIQKINYDDKTSNLSADIRGAKKRQGDGTIINSNRILAYAKLFKDKATNIGKYLQVESGFKSGLQAQIRNAGQSILDRIAKTNAARQRAEQRAEQEKRRQYNKKSRTPGGVRGHSR